MAARGEVKMAYRSKYEHSVNERYIPSLIGGSNLLRSEYTRTPIHFHIDQIPAGLTPDDQRMSILLPVSSSTNCGGGLIVMLSPWTTATCPDNEGFDTSCCTPRVKVDIGVMTIFSRPALFSAPAARFVAEELLATLLVSSDRFSYL